MFKYSKNKRIRKKQLKKYSIIGIDYGNKDAIVVSQSFKFLFNKENNKYDLEYKDYI